MPTGKIVAQSFFVCYFLPAFGGRTIVRPPQLVPQFEIARNTAATAAGIVFNLTGVMVLVHWFMRNTNILQVAGKIRWWGLAGIWALLVIALIVSQKSADSFIYFQF